MNHKELYPKSFYAKSLYAQLGEIHESMAKKRAKGNLDTWLEYGTSIEGYQKTFSKVLGGMNIVDFVSNRQYPIVIDIMAPSQTLVSLFTQIPNPGLGLAVSLEDYRTMENKKKDKELNVHQLAGDITQSSTWKVIDRELKGKKADLITERAKAGLYFIPYHKKFYAIMANRLWDRLSEEGGVMLIETLRFSENVPEHFMPIPKWANYLATTGIDVAYDPGNWVCGGTLRIVKETNSPKVLPFL